MKTTLVTMSGHEMTAGNMIALGLRWVRHEASVMASIFMPVAIVHPDGYVELVTPEISAGRGGHAQVQEGDIIVYPFRGEDTPEKFHLRIECSP